MQKNIFVERFHFLSSICALAAGFACLAASPSHAAPEVKVGIFLPMSGGTAAFGQDNYNGAKMAIEEINKKGEVKINATLEDDQSTPVGAANAARKLLNTNKVHVLVGSVPSSNTNAAAPLAQTAKVPLLTPASTNVNITQNGEFVSRICFIDDFQGLAIAKFAAETLKARSAAIILDSASDYSLGLSKAFKEAFAKTGGKIVAEVSYVAKDQDFSSQLTKVKNRKPDVVFVPGYYGDVANILRQAKKLAIQVPFLGGDGWSAAELFTLAGDAVVGNYFSDHFASDDTDPKVKEFVAKFTKKYGKAPNAMAALGYDAMYVVADAVKRAGGKTDGEALKNAINSTKNFVGVTGSITLDAQRNASKPLVILQTQADRATFKSRVQP